MQIILVGRSRVVSGAAVQQSAEANAKRAAGLDRDGASGALAHRGAAEGVGDEDAVIAVVPPAFSEVGRGGKQRDASVFAVHASGIVAPGRGLAPGRLGGFLAVAVEDQAAVLLGEGGGDAGAETHLFLIA